jgi:predicted thioesterase
MTGEMTVEVTGENTTRHLSGVQVFTTPHLVALMERTCMRVLEPHYGENESSVGVGINMRHLAATPIGMKVTCRCRVAEVKRRIVAFEVEAFDDQEKVGEGTHWRAVVNVDEVATRVQRKAGLRA